MTEITELTQETARESGNILIIVAARMDRREFFTPLHALCESGKRVVSTRALCDAVERAEERMVSQVSKIVDGHDRLTKKLKEAESRNAELVEALEKTQQRIAELEAQVEQMKSRELVISPITLAEALAEYEKKLPWVELIKNLAARNTGIHSQDVLFIAEVYERYIAAVSPENMRQMLAELDAARHRIAELESRTVKLPQEVSAGGQGYQEQVERALGDAGIKWEAE
ncbi:hypothetical protein [Shimwellia blattae]|uniref:Uncharacterized protein n=1 Tax=Shimwellia blattae (strain ATCC 29907 / DSM 4481 / JCM 1650 / NBRC 105725 / CDC 9005-74) TaxID=630626 RepID=I2B9T3_SHIBC|nr:hypothetical protein [Shimwellia blattae]AFJ47287.1 hypothetical protein EBL_c21960 [Shimwellia blattae DSM 4481 = NBRC 105725]GAB80520.1 hypothetical protein EB105725_05_02480 [Shimwellia blattae DSM 4481 = NBRC 105725]VDY64777.1 Uncharacterised protein [Shimwellia blattae]VEC22876.1 Uncharacterised protein [Shimwellia blattae]